MMPDTGHENYRHRSEVYDGFQQENVASLSCPQRLEFINNENGVYFLESRAEAASPRLTLEQGAPGPDCNHCSDGRVDVVVQARAKTPGCGAAHPSSHRL